MLYLLLCNNNIKIGYTSNLDSRMKTYKTHNPFAELIDTIYGDETLEAHFHSLLTDVSIE